ncbi:MAG TPA: YggT family protein [Candidatus Ligilactobacillus excrementipullorum]|nr:YggT family protein [Candidatus Ligilactobacillus excrementipullorum]
MIINGLFQVYTLLIVIFVLMSWFPGAYETKLGEILAKVCRPYLSLFDFVPPFFGISFAPLIAIIVLEFVQSGLIYLLAMLGLGGL